jgi:hypothetical protein
MNPSENTGHPVRSLLRVPDFLRLWLVGAFANAMRWLELLASGLFAYEVTGSALAVTAVVAARQLPQLAPETIRLLLSNSPGGVLDPPELFRLACDAADRGQGALTPAEAKELKALQRELVRTLRPAERRRVSQYDRARSLRAVFAFENRRALELYARGAQALPSRSRERLKLLLGKAIPAGLARLVEVAPWDVSQR